MLTGMIADTAFQSSSPWLCDVSTDGLQNVVLLPCDKSSYDTLDDWELDESDLLPSGTITDLAALLSIDADNDSDDVCLETMTTVDLDMLSASVLGIFEDSEDGVALSNDEAISLAVWESSLFSALDVNNRSPLNDAVSVAASTSSGYSSGCESCISNEDNARSISQRLSLPTPRGNTAATSCSAEKIPMRRKKLRKSDSSSSKAVHKKWSSMSEEEQRQVINDLTQVISTELGMRERLEAIHIINPHARVSSTDTECYIDLAPINDGRFFSLQKFVRMHTGNVLSRSSVTSTLHNSRRQGKQSSISSAYVEDHLVMCAKSKGRKRKGRNSRREQKALCRQLSKEEVQRLKEEQSGYFVREVRIAVSSSIADDEDDDDENIDILA